MWSRAYFRNRRDAGRKLGQRLRDEIDADVFIFGLPRGGVEVAFEVARTLHAPLDVIVARKVGAPMHPELGIGAVAEGGITLVDHDMLHEIGLSPQEFEEAAKRERAELSRRLQEYRGNDALADLSGKTAVIVDDGLATGVTALASIRAARAANPGTIVLAIPVCARETADQLAAQVDRLVCLEQPPQFMAVGVWYEQFDQTTDAEVIELLEEARHAVSPDEISEM